MAIAAWRAKAPAFAFPLYKGLTELRVLGQIFSEKASLQMTVARFSTRDIPAPLRQAYMQEVYGQIAKIDISPIAEDSPLAGEAAILGLPGAVVAHARVGPCRAGRGKRRIQDADDDIVLCIALSGGLTWSWRDDADVVSGGAYLGANDIPGYRIFPKAAEILDIVIPRKLIAPMAPGNASPRLFAATPVSRMLAAYAQSLVENADGLDDAALALAGGHIRDLAALLMGAGGDAKERAVQGGVRAARLAAIKADIDANLTNPALSVAYITGRHCISGRYLRALFAAEGDSFTGHVMAGRLALAFRMLTDPRRMTVPVGEIAYASGFNDLAYFNRAFRRRFEMTPTDARGAAFGRLEKNPPGPGRTARKQAITS